MRNYYHDSDLLTIREVEELKKLWRRQIRPAVKAHEDKKRQVYAQVEAARKLGQCLSQPCEQCGDPKAVGHHEDYDRPLDLIWLCRSCHRKNHILIRAKGRYEHLGLGFRSWMRARGHELSTQHKYERWRK